MSKTFTESRNLKQIKNTELRVGFPKTVLARYVTTNASLCHIFCLYVLMSHVCLLDCFFFVLLNSEHKGKQSSFIFSCY